MKKFEIEMLPPIPEEEPINYNSRASNFENKNTVRLCIDTSERIADKVRDHAYQWRLTQKEMLLKILEEYLDKNMVEPRPQALKEKGKPGPKRKIKNIN
ncbi:MAG: hypothetical protein ACYC2U_02635 [Candidatus Amoebophilus sp.]